MRYKDMKLKEFSKKHPSLKTICWIIVTALITIAIEKSCNSIMPEPPMIVKEVSDTVKIVHSYDFGSLNDSLIKMQLQSRLENIELAQQYEMEVIKQNKKSGIVNPIKHDVLFPNSKGYSIKNAMAYFSLNMSSLKKPYIEFDISFIEESIVNEIYCLTLKIFKIENNASSYFLEEFYAVQGINNKIRIVNTLPKGSYEFCVGFIFNKDRDAIYPNTYKVSKFVDI